MIVYVDLEHERLADVDAEKWRDTAARRLRTKYFLEDITGDECLVVRYSKVSPGLLTIQALQHRWAPVFGTQFHPEEHDDRHPDGRQIICNFFQYVGLSR